MSWSLGKSINDEIADQIVSQQNGLLFYGWAPAALPFQGGWMCVDPVLLERLVPTSSGGSPPPSDCSGQLAVDFKVHLQAGLDPGLQPGTLAYCQFWYRDPASPSTTGLSGGLVFLIEP